MSRKLQVTVTDEMYLWLEEQSVVASLPISTLVKSYLVEYRRIKDDEENMRSMLSKKESE